MKRIVFFTVGLVAFHFFSVQVSKPAPGEPKKLKNISDSLATPGVRAMHTLVYDTELRKVILLDGTWPAIQPKLTELWSWDGKHWELIPGSGPEARYVSSAAYDTRRKKIISYGGRVGKKEEIKSDTWEWDGHRWSLMNDTGVGARDHHMMAYDEKRGKTVMFGGGKFPRTSPWPTDTWEWNGTKWTQVATAGPDGRVSSMVYDIKNKQIVLFGGVGESPIQGQPQPFYNDTWTWNGKAWRKMSNEGPSARARHALSYDPKAGVVLMYGGATTREEQFDDMWQWDGKKWSEIQLTKPTPGKRTLHAMVYDAARGKTVLYGGNCEGKVMQDLWEWDGKHWAKISDH